MNIRDLMAKLDKINEAEAPAAAPTNPWTPKQDTTKQDAWAKLSPAQQQWLGGADPTDPYILARMRSAVPDEVAPAAQPAAQPAADDGIEKLAQLQALLANLKPAGGSAAAPAGTTKPTAPAKPAMDPAKAEKLRQIDASLKNVNPNLEMNRAYIARLQAEKAALMKESVGFSLNEDNTVTLTRNDGSCVTFDPTTMKVVESMSSSLMESFGYDTFMSNDELMEYSWDQFSSDAGDTARGAWQGATLGAGNNIAAGIKSAVGKGTYKDELAKQLAADKEAETRSPWLYGAGNVAGAMALPVPGGALANAAIKGASKAAGIGRAVAGTGINLGAQYAVGKGVNAANKSTLGYDPSQYPTSPDAVKAFQSANGLTPDGIIGPKTKAVLDKQGLTAPTVQEQIASLRDRLAMLESEAQVDEAMPNLGAMWNAAKTGAGKFVQGVKTGMKDLTPQQADMAKNLAGTTNKTGQKVGGAIKTVKNNPGTTAGAALAAGGGAMALGGGAAASPAGTTVDTTTNRVPPKPTGNTAPTASGSIDPEQLAQIEALMSELSQYNDPAIQQALIGARQTLSKVTGNNAIGAADQAAMRADLNSAETGPQGGQIQLPAADAAQNAAADAKAAADRATASPKEQDEIDQITGKKPVTTTQPYATK